MDVLISLVKEVSHDFSFWSFFSVKWDIPFLTQSLSKANNQNLRNLSYGIESADIMECPNSSSEYWWKRRRCLPHLSIFTSTFYIKKTQWPPLVRGHYLSEKRTLFEEKIMDEDIPQFYLMHIQTCDPFRLIASERKCLMDFSFIYQQYSR